MKKLLNDILISALIHIFILCMIHTVVESSEVLIIFFAETISGIYKYFNKITK